MNKISIILIIFFLKAQIFDPILYAVNVGDGTGLVLLRKLLPTCQYYISVRKTDPILLRFQSGQWEILQGAELDISNGCSQRSGTLLFTHEGEDMSNGSWINVQPDKFDGNFSIYALDDCTIYKGAFIDGNFESNKVIMREDEDPSQCPNKKETEKRLFPGVNINLYTTESTWNNESICMFKSIDKL